MDENHTDTEISRDSLSARSQGLDGTTTVFVTPVVKHWLETAQWKKERKCFI